MRAFFKRHWCAALIGSVVILLAVVGGPLVINWMFSQPAWCDFFAVDWETKDALAYYGSALGFTGTVIFSGLALWQNHVIKTESDKHTQLLEAMEQKKNMPILYFGSGSCSENSSNLRFHMHNISDNAALDIVVSKVSILNKDGSEVWNNGTEKRIHHLINSDTSISLNNPPLTDMTQYISFRVSYQDKFGNQHTMVVEGRQTGQNWSFPRFYTKEIT